MAPNARQLAELLAPRQAEMVALLERLVRAESPSRDPEAQRGVLALLKGELEARGFRVHHVRGRTSGGSLVALPQRRRLHQPHQLLIGHADTVWPLGTLETMPVEVDDGVMRGPGGYDMKAGLVQALFAFDALAAAEVTPELPAVMVVNTDEEIGSADSTPTIRRMARGADRCFVLEPSLGPEGRLKTARKGVGRFTVTVTGKAAHAGLDPERGASAILELSHVIQALFGLNDPERGVTVNVGTIDGGMGPNVVAPSSKAIVDVRVPNKVEAERVEAAIHRLRAVTPGTSLEIDGHIGRPPMEPSEGGRALWTLATEAAAELGLALDQAHVGGASDGNTTSQIAPTLDGLGAVGGGAHAPEEHLRVDRLVERTALVARLLTFPSLRSLRAHRAAQGPPTSEEVAS
jgi:glutamate carboxypeptidase